MSTKSTAKPEAKPNALPPLPKFGNLLGSDAHPMEFTIDGVSLSQADLVELAHGTSGLGVDEWNALPVDDRNKRIADSLAELQAEAANEARARAARAKALQKFAPREEPALPVADIETAQVFDTTARVGEPRTHQIVVGKHPDGEPLVKAYKLSSDVPTVMPLDHAMKFLVDKAFRVQRMDGTVIRPVDKPTDALANIRLEPDQVIARLDELSIDALLKRAKLLPDSQRFGANSAADDIIAFILAAQPKRDVGVSRGSEGVQEDPEAGNILDIRVPVTA